MKPRSAAKSTIFLLIIAGVLLGYLLAHFGYALELSRSDGKVNMLYAFDTLEANWTNPVLLVESLSASTRDSLTQKLPLFGLLLYLAFVLSVLSRRKLYRKGIEHGSARWATKKEAKKLLDEKGPSNAIILSNDVFLSLNTRYTQLNLNVVVIGGSGSGKSRFYVRPNLMQANTSFVITDPKGELLRSTGKMLEQLGYDVRVFNLVNMKHSFNYNPFAYLSDENGNFSDANVIKMVNVLMKNTKKEGHSGGDQFWEDSTEALLLALAFYLVYEGDEHEKNFGMMMELLHLAQASEEDESYQSPLDILFDDLEKEDPQHPAVRYYNIYKKAAGKTAKSILISTAVRLKAFNNQDVAALTSTDNLNLWDIGDKKTALFVVIPDSDDTFNFLVAMMYTQMFDILYRRADYKYGGRLPVHVRFLLDEFANIGTIPNFEKLVATMRSREISVNVIIQNIAQLKKMYKESWESIIGNCDSLLFLGGKEPGTLEYLVKAIGKQTIDTLSINTSRGKGKSISKNEGIMGRELMTSDEIERMPSDHCILLVRGNYPFYNKKFVIERHANYKWLAEANDKFAYELANIKTIDARKVEKKNIDKGAAPDENIDEEIRRILSDIQGDVDVTSTVEIPPSDPRPDPQDVIVQDLQDEDMQDVGGVENENKNENEFLIENLVVTENDQFSELNYDDEILEVTEIVKLNE